MGSVEGVLWSLAMMCGEETAPLRSPRSDARPRSEFSAEIESSVTLRCDALYEAAVLRDGTELEESLGVDLAVGVETGVASAESDGGSDGKCFARGENAIFTAYSAFFNFFDSPAVFELGFLLRVE